MRWHVIFGILVLGGCMGAQVSPPMATSDAQLLYGSNRDGNWEIYSMNLSVMKETRLTNSQADDLWPLWSPGGERIVFVSDRDGNRELYIMETDGSRQSRLVFNF